MALPLEHQEGFCITILSDAHQVPALLQVIPLAASLQVVYLDSSLQVHHVCEAGSLEGTYSLNNHL